MDCLLVLDEAFLSATAGAVVVGGTQSACNKGSKTIRRTTQVIYIFFVVAKMLSVCCSF